MAGISREGSVPRRGPVRQGNIGRLARRGAVQPRSLDTARWFPTEAPHRSGTLGRCRRRRQPWPLAPLGLRSRASPSSRAACPHSERQGTVGSRFYDQSITNIAHPPPKAGAFLSVTSSNKIKSSPPCHSFSRLGRSRHCAGLRLQVYTIPHHLEHVAERPKTARRPDSSAPEMP